MVSGKKRKEAERSGKKRKEAEPATASGTKLGRRNQLGQAELAWTGGGGGGSTEPTDPPPPPPPPPAYGPELYRPNCVIHVVNMPRCCISFWTSRYYSFQVLAMNAHVLDNELNGQ